MSVAVEPRDLLPVTPKEQRADAYRIFRRAVRLGRIKRGTSCQHCGKTGRRTNGRSILQAHHHRGYDRPLDIEWVCAPCHAKVTPPALGKRNGTHTHPDSRSRGSENGQAKLTESQVLEIFQSTEAPGKVAARLGVNYSTIYDIRYSRRWTHVTGGLSTDRERLERIASIIEAVDHRAMAGEEDPLPTLQVMTQTEISAIYAISKRKPESWRP